MTWRWFVCSLGVVGLLCQQSTTSAHGAQSPDARALLDAADQLRWEREKDPLDQAITQYRHVIDLARAASLGEVEARANLGLGIALGLRGLSSEAAPALERAAEAFRALGDQAREAESLIELAGANVRIGKSDSAIPQIRQGLTLARQSGDRRVEGAALNSLGWNLHGDSARDERREDFNHAIAIAVGRGDRIAQSDALLGRGFLESGEKVATGLATYRDALDVATAAGDLRNIGNALAFIGYATGSDGLGKGEEAVGFYRKALPLIQQAGDQIEEAYALSGLAGNVRDLGRVREAEALFRQALAVSRAIHDRGTEGFLLSNVGVALSDLGRRDEAVQFYKQALAVHRANHDRAEESNTLVGLAGDSLDAADYAAALDAATQALQLAREAGDLRREIYARDYIGLAHGALGQYPEALAALTDALDLAERQDLLTAQSSVHRYLGKVYALIGDRQRALEHFDRSVEIAGRTKASVEEAVGLALKGALVAEDGDPTSARAQLEQALTAVRRSGVPAAEARVAESLASVAMLQRDGRSAVRFLEQALAALRGSHDVSGQAADLAQMGNVYLLAGNGARAMASFREGLALSKTTMNSVAEAVALTGLMHYWTRLHQPAAAIFFGKEAVNLYQETRANLLRLDPAIQRAYIESRAQTYRDLADLLISLGRLSEAEQVLNLIKQQEFLDFVRREAPATSADKRPADRTPAEDRVLARYRTLADRIVEVGARRRELLAITNRTPDEEKELNSLESDLVAANAAFSAELDQIAADLDRTSAASTRVTEIKEDQSLMADLHEIGPGTVVVYTLLTPARYRAILMTSDVRKAVSVNIQAAELNRRIFAFRQALQAPTLDPRGPAKALYDVLLAPLARDLEQAHAKTVLWVLDGVLRYVPMAALYDGHRYLAESFQSVMITLASRSHLTDRFSGPWSGLGVGVSQAVAGFAPLPAVADELHGIFRDTPDGAGILSGRVLLDNAFTGDAFRSALHSHLPIVHIASHFQLKPGHDQDSFLLLGDGTHMTLAQLRNAPNMFEDVDLLTLSACNTAIGDEGATGEEIESFGVIAQRQGAHAVVSTLWPVADASTRGLMEQLYRARVSGGLSKAEALRQAQLALLHGTADIHEPAAVATLSSAAAPRGVRVLSPAGALPPFTPPANAPWAHPYYWAAFILIGNSR